MQGLAKRRLQTKACIAGARTLMMFFNVIFWIMGFILLIFGLWMRVSIGKVFEISPQFNFALPTLLIITGSAIMLVAVIACFCSSTDSSTLLYILSGIFFLIFALIIASSISGYFYRGELKIQLQKSLNHTVKSYGNKNIMDKDLDRIQTHFECCGVRGYEDWNESNWHTENVNMSYPDSCCKTLKHCDNISPDQAYNTGCYPTILSLFNDNLSTLGLGTFFLSLFQLCGVTLAICLANQISRAQYEEMY